MPMETVFYGPHAKWYQHEVDSLENSLLLNGKEEYLLKLQYQCRNF